MERINGFLSRKLGDVKKSIEANICAMREVEKMEAVGNLEKFPDFPHKGECSKSTGLSISSVGSVGGWGMAAYVRYATCLDCGVRDGNIFKASKK